MLAKLSRTEGGSNKYETCSTEPEAKMSKQVD